MTTINGTATLEGFRMHVLTMLAEQEAKLRLEMAFCRSISERRACNAAAEAYEAARLAVEAIVIGPRNGGAPCTRSEATSSRASVTPGT